MYKILKESYGKVNGKHSRLREGEILPLDDDTAAKLVSIGAAVKHKPHPKTSKLETKHEKGFLTKLKDVFNAKL